MKKYMNYQNLEMYVDVKRSNIQSSKGVDHLYSTS